MAHVGVLKEIERAGVRIDYIGGTSMGAIVGGLYACGYSAQQLEQLLLQTNLNDLINDKFPRDHKSFAEKEDSERYAFSLPVNKGKVQFPLSLSKGQQTFGFLVQLTYDQRNTTDFSQLPIPFYCIATDIETGEKVVLDNGYLPLAMNASGALPTLFSPVKAKGKMLIDGGVADNYPIEEMLQKEVDIIIGVDVQTSLNKDKEAETFSEVLVRISGFQTAKLMGPKKKKTDIYIKPDLTEYNMLSFGAQAEIITRGVAAARSVYPQLKELAEKQNPVQTPPKKLPESFRLDKLKLSQTSNYKTNYLLGKIRLQQGTTHSFSKLREGMSTLAATQNFDTFRYSLDTENGQEVLNIALEELPHKALFRGGLSYNDLFGASALLNITQKHALLKNDEVSADIILGQYFRYHLSYFIDKGRFWSIGVRAKMDQFETAAPFVVSPATGGGSFTASNTKVLAQTNTFYVQTVFREEALLGIGLEHQRNKFITNLLDNQSGAFLAVDDADYYSVLGYLKADTRDDAHFPKKGGFFSGTLSYYFKQQASRATNAFTPFLIGKAQMGATIPVSRKWTLNLNTMGGFTVGRPNISSFDFYLGGYGNAPLLHYQPFVGLTQQYAGGDSFIKGVIEFDYAFSARQHGRLVLHTGIIDDDIFSTKNWAKEPDYFGMALTYGLESFLGPLAATASYSPQFGRMVYYVNLGWQF